MSVTSPVRLSQPPTPPRAVPAGDLVVAVDGLPASLLAVDWAVRETLSTRQRLRLVHVIDWPHTCTEAEAGRDEVTAMSAEVLAEAAARAEASGARRVVTESFRGRLGPTFLSLSRPARTLVLGHRPMGGFAQMVLGSVAVAVATRAAGPVVVVPATVGDRRTPRGSVVVGVDGSAGNLPAARYAFRHAARHGFTVEAALVGTPTSSGEDGRAQAAMSRTARAFPSVRWRAQLLVGHPVEALTGAAAEAALLVVGCRTRRGDDSLLTDSVSRGSIFLSRVPVAVV